MKRISKIQPANHDEDVLLAIRRFSRENYGFTPERCHINKKKYNRNNSKRELRKEFSFDASRGSHLNNF